MEISLGIVVADDSYWPGGISASHADCNFGGPVTHTMVHTVVSSLSIIAGSGVTDLLLRQSKGVVVGVRGWITAGKPAAVAVNEYLRY
jgi:hypothetical protein